MWSVRFGVHSFISALKNLLGERFHPSNQEQVQGASNAKVHGVHQFKNSNENISSVKEHNINLTELS